MTCRSDVCFIIISEYFGPMASCVCRELYLGPKPLKHIVQSTNLKLHQVKQILSVMIQFGFVTYDVSRYSSCEYAICNDNLLSALHYPRYISTIYKNYGNEAGRLVKELVLNGRMSTSALKNSVLSYFSEGKDAHEKIAISNKLSTVMHNLVISKFIVQDSDVTDDLVPLIISSQNESLKHSITTSALNQEGISENENCVYWKLNYERFLQEIRNEMILHAVERRLDIHASVIMNHILKLSSKLNCSGNVTNAVSISHLSDSVATDTNGLYAVKYMDQYLTALEEEPNLFVNRTNEYNNNGVVVNIKNIVSKLITTCLSSIVMHKFGHKASRIFRLVYNKIYCELEQIQQIAMIPDKEAKQLTYKLLEQKLIRVQNLKTPSALVSVPSKVFFLFSVNLNGANKIGLDICFKSLYNCMERQIYEQRRFGHLYEKRIYTNTLMAGFGDKGATAQQILHMVSGYINTSEMAVLRSLEIFMEKLQIVELQINETILLLQLHKIYCN